MICVHSLHVYYYFSLKIHISLAHVKYMGKLHIFTQSSINLNPSPASWTLFNNPKDGFHQEISERLTQTIFYFPIKIVLVNDAWHPIFQTPDCT